jgi:hypothetical protein
MGAATDVVNGIDHYSAQGLRGGGFSFALIDGAGANKTMGTVPGAHGLPTISRIVPVLAAAQPVTSKHQINGTTTGTMWGNGAISTSVNTGKAGVTLECGSCHDPHGNGNYRILKPVPVDSGATVGVNIPDAGAKVYTTLNYWDVRDLNVPPDATGTDGYIANVAQWCSTCHTRYLAGSGSYKTNSGDAVFTYRHRSDRTDQAGVSRPNCIQCHVSHGSNVAMTGTSVGLNPGDTPVVGADSRLLRVNNRGTCVMCHNV